MTSTEPLKAGDRVTFFGNQKAHHGMVMDIKDQPDGKMVFISTVSTDFFKPNEYFTQKGIVYSLQY